jgi:hypothetical protein
VFLDYLEEPSSQNERRARGPEDGIYQYYRIEKAGIKALIILMDVRYERSKTFTISERQWRWFENVLKEMGGEHDVVLIGSGT